MTTILYDTLFGKYAGSEKTFITTQDGRIVSYGNFVTIAANFANTLTDIGLTKGDRVAVQVEKSVESLALYAACVQAGLIFLPLNTAYTTKEVSYFVTDSEAKVFICDGQKETMLSAVAQEANAVLKTLNQDGSGSLTDLAQSMPDTFETVDTSEDDLAAFLYTSGTTGRSKGAMLTQGNLLSNAMTLVDYWKFTNSDVLLHALPIFHTHGLFVATNVVLAAGASMIMMPKFDVDAVIEHIPSTTCLMGVPTFYTRLLSDDRFTKDITLKMRLFISGSAPLLAETHSEFEARTGHRILERYGMTETGMNTSNPYDGERRAGTVGFPLPGIEVKVTDPETGIERAMGEIGILEVRGPNVFKGYWKMPEKTKEELREDGFFITGDMAQIDEDGYIHIIGREKDMIISGGFNIYPKEVEVFLDEQSGVKESAVIGLAHPDFGESPLGLLVREKELEPDLEAIQKHISNSLARYKHPRKLLVINELPRNAMGKVQKNVLRDQYKDMFTH